MRSKGGKRNEGKNLWSKDKRKKVEERRGEERGGEEKRGEAVMASFQLFARHGSGHLGNTNPAAKERKTRKEREGGTGEDDGKREES